MTILGLIILTAIIIIGYKTGWTPFRFGNLGGDSKHSHPCPHSHIDGDRCHYGNDDGTCSQKKCKRP